MLDPAPQQVQDPQGVLRAVVIAPGRASKVLSGGRRVGGDPRPAQVREAQVVVRARDLGVGGLLEPEQRGVRVLLHPAPLHVERPEVVLGLRNPRFRRAGEPLRRLGIVDVHPQAVQVEFSEARLRESMALLCGSFVPDCGLPVVGRDDADSALVQRCEVRLGLGVPLLGRGMKSGK